MRKTKPKTKIEVKPEIKSPNVNLKFKITNLRTSAYPGPLVKTDYLELEIGDLVVKGSNNTVYEVVLLDREAFNEEEYNEIHRRAFRLSDAYHQKIAYLIDEYKKNGNFGVCWITLKPIIRGSKQVHRGRFQRINEIHHVAFSRYNAYKKVTLEELINNRQANIYAIGHQIQRWNKKMSVQIAARDILDCVLAFRKSETEIQVFDNDGKVIHSIDPKQLI